MPFVRRILPIPGTWLKRCAEVIVNDADGATREGDGKAEACEQDLLRRELMASGLEDWVSMAEVQQLASSLGLADADAARQKLVLATIRSVLEDGLMEIGDLPGEDGQFPAWDGSVDSLMVRLSDRFIRYYDEPAVWDYSIWLGLTDQGERVAKTMSSD